MRPRISLTLLLVVATIGLGVWLAPRPGAPAGPDPTSAATPAPSPLAAPVPPGGASPEPTGPAPPPRATAGTPSPSPSVSPSPAAPAADGPPLPPRLERAVARSGLRAGTAELGIVVRDTHGRTALHVAGDAPLIPASTMKIVTAATALRVLGPGHRFVTTAGTAGELRDGVLHGDVVVTGAGDPVLATPAYDRFVYPSRPRTPLENLADDVVAAGVRRITGDVVADVSLLDGPPTARGWKSSYLAGFHARPIRALTVDAGLTIGFRGPATGPNLQLDTATDPARRAASQLARLLRERGVAVDRGVQVSESPVPAPRRLGDVSSPPLRELVHHMLRESDNHLADTLIRVVGRAHGGDGSWRSGARAARAVLARLGVDTAGMVVADGSGLSRSNRLSAGQLVELYAAMGRSELAGVWRGAMAVAGRAGTLEGRLDDTVGEAVFRGKTGTLGDVAAVVGAVRAPDGRRAHLAVLANGVPAARSRARALMDQLVLLIAEEQRGCRRRPAPSASATGGILPPYTVDCPGRQRAAVRG